MSSFWNLWVLSYMVKDVIQLWLLRRANSGLPGWALSQWQTSLQETQRGQTQRRGQPHDPGGGARSAAATSPGMLTATRRGSLLLEPLWGVELQASRNVTRIHFCCFKRFCAHVIMQPHEINTGAIFWGESPELSSDYKRGSYESHKVKELLL